MSKIKPLPSQTELKVLFDYNPETGVLSCPLTMPANPTKREKFRHTRWAGKEMGTISNGGYRVVCIPKYGAFLAHRVIWKIMTGCDPSMVDHKDRNTQNNKWANLRICTMTQNLGNQTVGRGSTTGYKNIWWNKLRGKWRVSVGYMGKRESRQTVTLAGAIAWRRLKTAQLYGEFARAS